MSNIAAFRHEFHILANEKKHTNQDSIRLDKEGRKNSEGRTALLRTKQSSNLQTTSVTVKLCKIKA